MENETNQAINEAIREKMAGPVEHREQLGRIFSLSEQDVFQAIKRSDYQDDEQYLDACTRYELERSTPEYRKIRGELARRWRDMNEAQQREDQKAEYAKIRKSVTLDSYDQKIIDQEAGELARRDLAAGKIGASDLGAAIETHAKELKEKRLDQKANSALFNGMIRGSWKG